MHKTKTLFFFIQGYSLITKDDTNERGVCRHVSGNVPYRCVRRDVSSQSSCEAACTSQTSCIAYSYNIGDVKYRHCYLIPSERSCPLGFEETEESAPIAASMNDLKAEDSSYYVCYGKN